MKRNFPQSPHRDVVQGSLSFELSRGISRLRKNGFYRGMARSEAVVGSCCAPGGGQGCLNRGCGVRYRPRLPLSGPAGHSAPWEGHATWTAEASCAGASSFAIRTRL